jgi:hypothetical protein
VGLSGAGKSTFLNMIAPDSGAKTGDVRESDGRGRHTTTGSRLYLIPPGALIIDTPGIRVVGIAAGSVSAEASFKDIAELARGCRFVDCRHQSEPGCAVKEALLRGKIEEDRYLNYLRLTGEASSREVSMDAEPALGEDLESPLRPTAFLCLHCGAPVAERAWGTRPSDGAVFLAIFLASLHEMLFYLHKV